MKNLLRFILRHSQRNIKLVTQLSDKAKINHKRSLLSSIYCEHLLVENKIEPQWRGNLLQGIMTGPKGVVFFLSFLGPGEGKQSALVVFNLFLQNWNEGIIDITPCDFALKLSGNALICELFGHMTWSFYCNHIFKEWSTKVGWF